MSGCVTPALRMGRIAVGKAASPTPPPPPNVKFIKNPGKCLIAVDVWALSAMNSTRNHR